MVNNDNSGCTATSRTTMEHKVKRKIQIRWTKIMKERKIFMEDLKAIRKEEYEDRFNAIKEAVGPKWYHTFSNQQRQSLDGIAWALRNDRLEGVPWRTKRILSSIGVYPLPDFIDLRSAVYVAECNPSKFFAYLCLSEFNTHFSARCDSYDLKSRLILSAMYYTGVGDIFKAFKKIFAPDPVKKKKARKKTKEQKETEVYASPYLEPLTARCFFPKDPKPPEPDPLPRNLKCINKTKWKDAPTAEEMREPPPPPPPPPPPKRLPRDYCDEVAGINRELAPKFSPLYKYVEPVPLKRGIYIPKPPVIKKTYGLNLHELREKRMRKPKMPKTGVEGWYYHIISVYTIKNKKYFVLGSICTTRVKGELIHGGHAMINNDTYVRIHDGIRGEYTVDPSCEKTCQCLETYSRQAYKVLKKTKCRCGHIYDYGNRGRFYDDQLPYFDKPTRDKSYKFNEDVIFQITDLKELHIRQQVKNFLEDDSVLRIGPKRKKKKRKTKKVHTQTPHKISRAIQSGDDNVDIFADSELEEIEDESSSVEEEEIIDPSQTCLGENPKMMSYIKCAIQYLKETVLVANLPDLHKVPEIKEWMRKRMYGPLTPQQLKFLRKLSGIRFNFLRAIEVHGYHTHPKLTPDLLAITNWAHKDALLKNFNDFIQNNYFRKMFDTQSMLNNYLWAAMFNPMDPVKNFRDCFFSYLPQRPNNLALLHPYFDKEIQIHNTTIQGKRLICRTKRMEDFIETR